MKYKKFREPIVDVFSVDFKNIKVKKILNYMPAGNDVLEVITNDNEEYFVKIERSKIADFKTEYINIIKIRELGYTKAPNVIEFINNDKNILVLSKVKGSRLSEIINKKNADYYLRRFGEELAIIHKINSVGFNTAKQRVINDIPYDGLYCKLNETAKKYINYLNDNNYKKSINTFIHGDFHYANVLWYNKSVSGVLDWEYSGLGHKEQDIAWSLIVRPNQKFLDSMEDIDAFLKGYKKYGNYDSNKLKWCLINGYLHFYLMNDDKIYRSLLAVLMRKAIEKDF